MSTHARKKINTHHTPMKSLEIPPPFSRWHLDFIGELPTTKNRNRWIILAVDYNTTVDQLLRNCHPILLSELVTSRGANFMSKILKQYISLQAHSIQEPIRNASD